MTNKSTSSENHGLKKGPWTPEEDQKLVDYIHKYGYGKWRTLPKNAGLKRCGKSCRLRWTNYLRPDIKRGRFSLEEEEVIIQLHSALGNKWSTIAANLPGRTDNEIKNYWNTHVKKKLMKMGIDPVTHTPRLDILQLASILNSSLHNSPQFNNLDHFSLGRMENPNHLYLLNLLTTLLSCQNKNLNDSNYNVHQNQFGGNDNSNSDSLQRLQNPQYCIPQFKIAMESQLTKTKLVNQIAPIATSFNKQHTPQNFGKCLLSNIQQPESSTMKNILENHILSNIEEMPNFDLSSLFSASPSSSSPSNLKSQSSTTFVNGTIEDERDTYGNNFMMYNISNGLNDSELL